MSAPSKRQPRHPSSAAQEAFAFCLLFSFRSHFSLALFLFPVPERACARVGSNPFSSSVFFASRSWRKENEETKEKKPGEEARPIAHVPTAAPLHHVKGEVEDGVLETTLGSYGPALGKGSQ